MCIRDRYTDDRGYSHVSAVTQSLTIKETSDNLSWYFESITLHEGASKTNIDKALFQIPSGNRVVISKRSNGSVKIDMRENEDCGNNNSSCTFMTGEVAGKQIARPLSPSSTLVLPENSSDISLSIRGIVSIGRTLSESDSNYLPLISGAVTFYGSHTLIASESHYVSSSIDLTYGDEVSIGDAISMVYTHGLANLSHNSDGILISATSAKPVTRIVRFNTEATVIKEGWLTRLYHDRGLSSVWTGVFLIIGFLLWLSNEARQ